MSKELFQHKDQEFSFIVANTTLSCKRLSYPGYVAFEVTFSSIRAPIVIARAKDFEAGFFWTSIPEGRQREAEGVGKLIEEYLLEKR